MALNFLMIGVLGGFFLVPLNALIQFHAGEQGLGRILAANNFIQNLVMLGVPGAHGGWRPCSRAAACSSSRSWE